MSYSHLHLPSLEVLKNILKENPSEIKYYLKYSAWVGPSESIDYLTNITKSLNN